MSIARHPFCRWPVGYEAPGRSPGQGGYLLYRGVASVHPAVSAADVDFTAPVGHGQAGVTRAYDYAAGLVASTEYVYALRAVSDLGVEETGVLCLARVKWEGAGVEGGVPNAVDLVSAQAAAGGTVRLQFLYSQRDGAAVAAAVQVAWDAGGGYAWAPPLATIDVAPSGATHYDGVLATGWPDGATVHLAVRAVTAAGVGDAVAGPVTVLAPVTADATDPDPVTSLTVVQET
jgi:hypothetical protein